MSSDGRGVGQAQPPGESSASELAGTASEPLPATMRREAGFMLTEAGDVARRAGAFLEARSLYERALVLYADEEHGLLRLMTLIFLSNTCRELGDLPGAEQALRDCLEIEGPLAELPGQRAAVLHDLGELRRALGDPDEAASLFAAVLAMATREGSAERLWKVHSSIEAMARERGEKEQAERHGVVAQRWAIVDSLTKAVRQMAADDTEEWTIAVGMGSDGRAHELDLSIVNDSVTDDDIDRIRDQLTTIGARCAAVVTNVGRPRREGPPPAQPRQSVSVAVVDTTGLLLACTSGDGWRESQALGGLEAVVATVKLALGEAGA